MSVKHNFAAIGRACIGPGGATYSRCHINEVLHRRRYASMSLAEQLVACGAIANIGRVRVRH